MPRQRPRTGLRADFWTAGPCNTPPSSPTASMPTPKTPTLSSARKAPTTSLPSKTTPSLNALARQHLDRATLLSKPKPPTAPSANAAPASFPSNLTPPAIPSAAQLLILERFVGHMRRGEVQRGARYFDTRLCPEAAGAVSLAKPVRSSWGRREQDASAAQRPRRRRPLPPALGLCGPCADPDPHRPVGLGAVGGPPEPARRPRRRHSRQPKDARRLLCVPPLTQIEWENLGWLAIEVVKEKRRGKHSPPAY